MASVLPFSKARTYTVGMSSSVGVRTLSFAINGFQTLCLMCQYFGFQAGRGISSGRRIGKSGSTAGRPRYSVHQTGCGFCRHKYCCNSGSSGRQSMF